MMSRLTIYIIIFGVISLLITGDDPCRFEDSSKGVIDLSSVGNTDGKAAFPDEVPTLGADYLYSYNPCKPFSEGTDCTNVASCQVAKNGAARYNLGTQDSAKWNSGSGPGSSPTISYSFNQKQLTVILQCSESTTGTFVALGETEINKYQYTLSHKCACWDGCKNSPGPKPNPPPGGGGIAGGTIFIAVLAILAVVYFIIFAIYYRVRHQRSGRELIAHRTFWVALPAHARDGVVYIFRRATGKGGLEYQKV